MTLSRGWVEEEGIEGSTSCFLLNGKATLDSYLSIEAVVFDATDEGDPLSSYGGSATASSSSPSSGEEVTNRLLGRRPSGEADAVRFGGNGGDDDISVDTWRRIRYPGSQRLDGRGSRGSVFSPKSCRVGGRVSLM